MTFDQQAGTTDIRAQVVDGIVKGFAERQYKFKQAVTEVPTSAWKNVFFRESNTPLTGQSGNSGADIPRGADFPHAVVQWERVNAYIAKYGLEQHIDWEDLVTDDVDARDRALFRIAEGVTKYVDDAIWSGLTENDTPTNIQSITVSSCWNFTSAAIIDDISQGIQKLAEYNYDTSNVMLFVTPREARWIKKWVTDKGAQFNSLSNDIAINGGIGKLAGATIIQSNSVAASRALLVVPKRCATWSQVVPLTTVTKEDPYKDLTVRAVEVGTVKLTDPKAVVYYTSVEGTGAS